MAIKNSDWPVCEMCKKHLDKKRQDPIPRYFTQDDKIYYYHKSCVELPMYILLKANREMK